MRSLALAMVLLTPLSLLSQEVVFKDLNIHPSNKLLYSVEVPAPGTPGYTTSVLADLNTGEMEPLTFYPERAVFFSGLRTLQLQNRLGVYRRGATGTISVLKDEGFFQGESIAQGKLLPLLASPNGQYLVYFEPKSVTRGDLYMKRVSSGEEIILSRNVPLSFNELPVLWAPDSRHLVYGHSGVVYYFSIAQWEEKRVPAQEFRILAEAALGAFKWSDDRELYFINGAQIYRILPEEFFTRSLYGGQFQVGGVVGKLPFRFDPYTDKFWISPGKDKLVVNWQGRFLFYYDLALPDFYSSSLVTSLPYLPLPQNMKVIRVLWSEGGLATILARSLEGTRTGSVIYRLGADIDSSQILFKGIDEKVIDLVGSPLSTNMAIVYENGVSVRRSLDFTERTFLSHDKTLGALWNNETGLYVLGEKATLQADVANNTQRIVLISQLDDMGFTEDGEVYGLLEGVYYRYDGEGRWSSRTEPPELLEPNTANDQYRVYTQAFTANYYANQIMLRKNDGLGTEPLFTVLPDDYEPFPEKDEPLTGDIYTHGTRIRNRVLSLVINAPDELDGLDRLLQSLADYNFKVTFFLGGDFIRRHPGALKEILAGGHEVGSHFYLNFDFGDPRYEVDVNFIKKGLAQNEDDFYLTTGKELELIWHAPGYFYDPEVAKATDEMNYLYVGRDVKSDQYGFSVDANYVIEDILDLKKPGSIVPLSLGMIDAASGESLFGRLDLLLNALVQKGYRVVTVSSLREEGN